MFDIENLHDLKTFVIRTEVEMNGNIEGCFQLN